LTINTYWGNLLLEEAAVQNTARYISTSSLSGNKQAAIWTSSVDSLRDTYKAFVKVKLLTGTYLLQALASKFSGSNVTPTCQLCHNGVENRSHFILECHMLQHVRTDYITDIETIVESEIGEVPSDQDDFLQIVLDSSGHIKDADTCELLEHITRDFLYDLHNQRWKMLQMSLIVKQGTKTKTRRKAVKGAAKTLHN
jgi:GTPase SAR1 family protein